MAELTLSPGDIAAALKKNLEGFEPRLEARTVGRCHRGRRRNRPSADSRIAASTNCSSSKTAVSGSRSEPRRRVDRRRSSAMPTVLEEGQTVKATAELQRPSRRRSSVDDERVGEPIDGRGRNRRRYRTSSRDPSAGHHGPQAGARADADRHQVDRCDDSDRSWPARADHRRPQQTGKTTVAIDSIINQRGLGVKCTSSSAPPDRRRLLRGRLRRGLRRLPRPHQRSARGLAAREPRSRVRARPAGRGSARGTARMSVGSPAAARGRGARPAGRHRQRGGPRPRRRGGAGRCPPPRGAG